MNTGMTVGQLKELLEGLDDDMPVMILQQPSWPFAYGVQAGITRKELIEQNLEELEDKGLDTYGDLREDAEESRKHMSRDEKVDALMSEGDVIGDAFYIVEGRQLRYADGIEKYGFESGGY